MTDTPFTLTGTILRKLSSLYSLPCPFECSLLKYSENIIYLLKFDNGEKRVFRIRRPGYHTKDEILSELLWMREISEQTDVLLPTLYLGKNGEVMQKITSVISGESYLCDMMSFVEGKSAKNYKGKDFERAIEKIGEITAKLHLQAINRDKSVFLSRYSWNEQSIFGPVTNWGSYRDYKEITPSDLIILEKAENIICRRLREFGRANDRYGIIHADLHLDNIFVDGDNFTVIDFDDCGYGYYLYDLGCTLLYISDDIEKYIDIYLKGYEKVRPLSEEEKDMLLVFVVLRRIVRLAWLASHADSDTAKSVSPDYYPKTIEIIKKLF